MLNRKCLSEGLASEQTSEVQTVGYLVMEGEMAEFSPMRRRQLGMELRRLREAAGKRQGDAKDYTGLQATAISKIERGKQKIRQADLKLLLQFYGVGSPHADALERIRKEADKRGWWADYGNDIPGWFRGYVGMETAAAEVWVYETELVPGLLQTPDYTQAISAANPADAEQADRFTEVRLARQKRITDDDSLIVRAVINEAVIRRPVGGPEVMRAQLDRLAEAAALPNVTLQLLPFSTGEHPAMLGGFTALRFPEEPLNVIFVEFDTGSVYVEQPSQVERYVGTFEQLSSLALSESETAELIDQERGK